MNDIPYDIKILDENEKKIIYERNLSNEQKKKFNKMNEFQKLIFFSFNSTKKRIKFINLSPSENQYQSYYIYNSLDNSYNKNKIDENFEEDKLPDYIHIKYSKLTKHQKYIFSGLNTLERYIYLYDLNSKERQQINVFNYDTIYRKIIYGPFKNNFSSLNENQKNIFYLINKIFRTFIVENNLDDMDLDFLNIDYDTLNNFQKRFIYKLEIDYMAAFFDKSEEEIEKNTLNIYYKLDKTILNKCNEKQYDKYIYANKLIQTFNCDCNGNLDPIILEDYNMLNTQNKYTFILLNKLERYIYLYKLENKDRTKVMNDNRILNVDIIYKQIIYDNRYNELSKNNKNILSLLNNDLRYFFYKKRESKLEEILNIEHEKLNIFQKKMLYYLDLIDLFFFFKLPKNKKEDFTLYIYLSFYNSDPNNFCFDDIKSGTLDYVYNNHIDICNNPSDKPKTSAFGINKLHEIIKKDYELLTEKQKCIYFKLNKYERYAFLYKLSPNEKNKLLQQNENRIDQLHLNIIYSKFIGKLSKLYSILPNNNKKILLSLNKNLRYTYINIGPLTELIKSMKKIEEEHFHDGDENADNSDIIHSDIRNKKYDYDKFRTSENIGDETDREKLILSLHIKYDKLNLFQKKILHYFDINTLHMFYKAAQKEYDMENFTFKMYKSLDNTNYYITDDDNKKNYKDCLTKKNDIVSNFDTHKLDKAILTDFLLLNNEERYEFIFMTKIERYIYMYVLSNINRQKYNDSPSLKLLYSNLKGEHLNLYTSLSFINKFIYYLLYNGERDIYLAGNKNIKNKRIIYLFYLRYTIAINTIFILLIMIVISAIFYSSRY